MALRKLTIELMLQEDSQPFTWYMINMHLEQEKKLEDDEISQSHVIKELLQQKFKINPEG
jgi:hypothetical protein